MVDVSNWMARVWLSRPLSSIFICLIGDIFFCFLSTSPSLLVYYNFIRRRSEISQNVLCSHNGREENVWQIILNASKIMFSSLVRADKPPPFFLSNALYDIKWRKWCLQRERRRPRRQEAVREKENTRQPNKSACVSARRHNLHGVSSLKFSFL